MVFLPTFGLDYGEWSKHVYRQEAMKSTSRLFCVFPDTVSVRPGLVSTTEVENKAELPAQ
jgi:hypothetical protein